ncbi:LacI family DNA-binding transcriptional regulator [Streptomyces sp. NBC_01244]|uniref:LacI family DNA-binding transcriptional regulator n=1 Tax=Streptomyces sp. NBC_01244 TaxID=2903797 RepID=UPI002E100C3B|nr:LacI family transcriptional regulator [Streptomyces sp. NBC_01244]
MPPPAPVPGPTLADIARAAEVSTATVSHALNGTGRLGESTRRRVREVAGALGYGARRGPHNRSLGIAVTTYAGFAWDFARIAYYARLLIAATSAAHAHGYALTTLPADRGAEPLWHTLAVDGMLLLDSPADDPVLRALRARGLPVVFDGPPADPRPGDVWVDNDHTATTREVLDHLEASGARRIALHAGYGREFYTGAVTSAYEHWCAERRRTPLVIPFDPNDDAGHAFDSAFAGPDGRHRPDRPDAVYCVYDPGGRQVLAAAARHGIAIPGAAPGAGPAAGPGEKGLLLVCASEDPAYAENEPAVTTVTFDPERIAETAVSSLVKLIESGHAESTGRLTVPAGLRVRASSRAPGMY